MWDKFYRDSRFMFHNGREMKNYLLPSKSIVLFCPKKEKTNRENIIVTLVYISPSKLVVQLLDCGEA